MSNPTPPSTAAAPLLAMIALNRAALPSSADFLAGFARLSAVAVAPVLVKAKEHTFIFPLGKDHAVVGLMPVPIPWSNLEGPCATAWWWPEATARMRDHTSHLLLALAGGKGSVIQRHIALTQLTAAVAAVADAAGIYWGGGTLVHEPQAFQGEAEKLSPRNPPLHLWIDFRVERHDDGSTLLFTTGMKAFGLMEIEIPPCRKEPPEVLDFARAIAAYLIVEGANIRDGHTVGRSKDEHVAASHAASMWNEGIKVLRLEF